METITEFHRDLATFPKSQILTLAKFYGFDGSYNDLLWMIAIRHYYNSHKRGELKSAQLEFAEKLPALIKAGSKDRLFPTFDPVFLDQLNTLIRGKKQIREITDVAEKKSLGQSLKTVEQMVETHPDWAKVMALKSKFEYDSYYKWILNSYLNRDISRLEDIGSLLIPTIKNYKLLEKNGIEHTKAITELHGLIGLERYLDDFQDQLTELKAERDMADAELQAIRAEGPIVYDGITVRIRHPKTKRAACYYGRGTKWCTAATKGDNYFDEYNKDGPLYIIIPKTPSYPGEKYQFHEESGQYLNEKDEVFDKGEFIKRYEPDIEKIYELTGLKNQLLLDAIKRDDLEVVRKLLEDPRVDPTVNDNWAIQVASDNGHLEVVRLLLADPRVDPSADDNWAIRQASENDHLEVVRLLLADPRVDPSVDDNWVIRQASENGQTEIVRLLLADPRVDPSDKDNWAIRRASENGQTEVVRLLLADPRVDPSDKDNYALRQANLGGHFEVVRLLRETRV